MESTNIEEFKKIIHDFKKDLGSSFPELKSTLDELDDDEVYAHCKDIFPENFFLILYENNELFDNEKARYILPKIDFYSIMNDESLSTNSKKTIWKYIQLILFSVCNQVKDKTDFGKANYLFEAIQEDDLHNKINETMEEMKNIFMNANQNMNGEADASFEHLFENMMGDLSNVENLFQGASGENPFKNMMGDLSNVENLFQGASGENPFKQTMDAEQMKSHLSGIMDGKIGNLAKEIAEEASNDLGLDAENLDEKGQQDFLQKLFKNPAKIMDIVKNIGSKLEAKFKSGEIKESELMEEAQDIMKKMETMPGMKEMMSSMGMNPGGKFDFKGMANKMQQNMKQAKTKERMQEKLERNRKEKERQEDLGKMTQISEETFVWNESNSNPNEPLKKSKKSKKKNKAKKKKN